MTNITKLRALLEAANEDIDQLVLLRNDYLPALLDRLEKLEALAEAARRYHSDTCTLAESYYGDALDEALAALDT